MDKRLLDQIQQAMQAQQDTIKRQKQMLNDQEQYMERMLNKKDQDIAELMASLNKLAKTKTQELERLPTLFKQLQASMTEQTSVFNGWIKHRKDHATTQAALISELWALGNVQIQHHRAVEDVSEYDSTARLY